MAAFMVPGVATNGEVQREALQLHCATVVIIPTIPEFRNTPVKWMGPEFRRALEGARIVFKGRYFELYQRRNTYWITSSLKSSVKNAAAACS